MGWVDGEQRSFVFPKIQCAPCTRRETLSTHKVSKKVLLPASEEKPCDLGLGYLPGGGLLAARVFGLSLAAEICFLFLFWSFLFGKGEQKLHGYSAPRRKLINIRRPPPDASSSLEGEEKVPETISSVLSATDEH